jgi:hypothetical protein
MDDCRTTGCEGRVDVKTSPGPGDFHERFCDGTNSCRYVWSPTDDQWHPEPYPFDDDISTTEVDR